jgi:hypothetical protein
MQQAADAEKQQKFADAIQAYTKALQLQPGDPKATGALKLAQYRLYMAEGQRALAAKQFPAAARQFEAALQLFPGNPQATAALQQARQGKR